MRPARGLLARYVWAGVAVVFVTLVIGGAAWWIIALESHGREAQQHLMAARAALSQNAVSGVLGDSGPPSIAAADSSAVAQLNSACAEAAQADSALQDISGQMQAVQPAIHALSSLPGLGDRARAQTSALEAGTQLAAAGAAICVGLQPLADLFTPGAQATAASGNSTQDALQALMTARTKLVEAADRLDGTLNTLTSLSEADVDASARPSLEALRAQLPTVVQTLRDTAALFDLLGAQGDKRFLLVSQNSDELRATGGYIGSAGVLLVQSGNVRLLEYGSSQMYNTPAAQRAVTPKPFDTYLGDYWQLAGANWWASFPDVARQLEYFYSLARPDQPALDGVVALDQFGLQGMLEVLGPVDVPEYSERVDATNVQSALDRYVHAGDATDEQGRKQFTASLSTAVLRGVLATPRSRLPDLVRAVRKELDQQHLIVSVSDPLPAAVLARRRWDGGLLPATRDALLVVDTELTASKQSQAIQRDVVDQVDLRDSAAPTAHVALTYTNQSEPKPNVTYFVDYHTFVRIYAPGGAVLSEATGFLGDVRSDVECGRAVFGGEVSIPRGATVHVDVTYRLPSAVADGAYDLVVQQQPGVPAGRLRVQVTGPNGVLPAIERTNMQGQNYHWQESPADGPGLSDRALPQAASGGCGIPVVPAMPIAAPAWLDIPVADISAPIVDLGVDADGLMEPPPTPEVVGWYRMSARVGQPGNAVFSGHVDWGQNTAVFWGLRNLVADDPILVRGADGVVHRYVVEQNRVYSRSDPAAATLVNGSKGSLLTLITCDGVYDRAIRDYSGRRIVQAILSE